MSLVASASGVFVPVLDACRDQVVGPVCVVPSRTDIHAVPWRSHPQRTMVFSAEAYGEVPGGVPVRGLAAGAPMVCIVVVAVLGADLVVAADRVVHAGKFRPSELVARNVSRNPPGRKRLEDGTDVLLVGAVFVDLYVGPVIVGYAVGQIVEAHGERS